MQEYYPTARLSMVFYWFCQKRYKYLPNYINFLKLFRKQLPQCAMRILASIAALSVSVLAQRQNVVFLDESTPCSDFDEKFGSFDGMKTKCKGKSNKKKTKQFCNLICENGHANVWSTKPIKVSSKIE